MTQSPRDPLHWDRIRQQLGWNRVLDRVAPHDLPFGPGDTTAGTELEWQAVVVGDRTTADLPRTIEASSYYANLKKRFASQDTPRRRLRELERFLHQNPDGVWDNSWVRLPRTLLCDFARQVLETDLLADKRRLESGARSDGHRFTCDEPAGPLLRIPVSYLLKLALADAIGQQQLPAPLAGTGRRMLQHFLSDNTSPETFSFYIAQAGPDISIGQAATREMALRYLMTQALAAYANERFGLIITGQRVMIYLSPLPAGRQRELNDCISDGFYRQLFMSPCLSGWDQGEAKHDYMRLCHEVLSRSHLNAVAKVRDAGLIASNLVVLPNTSNISLANNGIHVSLGSRRLSALREDGGSGFGRAEEKCVGDLITKIVEHFVPLFVGTYTAAPCRFDFADFHPERVLGYLPHELDFTHLRMLWRRWRKKAKINVFGQPLTATGLRRLDRVAAACLRLRGDFVPDGRLIDYLVAPLSTDESPALDGTLGNGEKLKRDLAEQGVFDPRLSLYSFYRLRMHEQLGFCGFEARYYSLCESLRGDLGMAVDLQTLITALAFKYVANGTVTHADIPDDPTIESERRQIIFGGAIGIPTFFIASRTANKLLRRIVARASRARQSHRYPGYHRVYQTEYRRALIRLIREDGGDLVESLGLSHVLDDLSLRIDAPDEHAASGKLTAGILRELGARDPFRVAATPFNRAAERYYRQTLRRRHLAEAIAMLKAERQASPRRWADLWSHIAPAELALQGPAAFLDRLEQTLASDRADLTVVVTLINLLIALVHEASPPGAAHVQVTDEGSGTGGPRLGAIGP